MADKVDEQTRLIRIWTRVILRVFLILAAFIAGAWLVYSLRTVLLLLVLSVFFCYLIAPIVKVFEQPIYVRDREFKLPTGVAIIAVYAVFGAALFALMQLLIPVLGQQLTQLGKELPDYASRASASLSRGVRRANLALGRLGVPGPSQGEMSKWTEDIAADLLPRARDIITGALAYLVYLPWLILVPILSFFMLKDAPAFAEGLVALMPTERLQRRAQRLLVDISKTLAGYIRAQLTSCLLIGTVASIALWIIGVPYGLVLGVLAGVLEFIPMVGPLIAIVISTTLAMLSAVKLGLIVLIFLIALRFTQDYIIYPRIIGHGIKMHPFLVIAAILCGAEIDGVVGIFLAVPVVGLVIVGYNHYLSYRRTLALGITDTGELSAPPGAKL